MKVLILSITAGEGHNSTAKALKAELEAGGAQCEFLDTYGYINKAIRGIVANGYLFFSSRTKRIYAKAYRRCEKRSPSGKFSPSRITNNAMANKLCKYINEYNPDVIVCTHIFAAMLVDILKTNGKTNAKLLSILTDFVFHPYWEEGLHADKVVIPNDMLVLQAKKKGYTDNQIEPIGIPIRRKFENIGSREKARESLGIDRDKMTVLIMGGSMGFGKLDKVVKSLDRIPLDFQMLVVCGNNAAAKEKIEKLELEKSTKVYGFVDNIDVMMDASDCIVSKPGGLTTSEALAKRLPMIIVNPIPGQEDRNREFLLNNGTAMAVSDTCPIDDVIFQLFSNPDRVEKMRKNIDNIRRPHASADLCDLIRKLAEERQAELSVKSQEVEVK
ncbi:MAG: glycosyltransferase [Clostridia bacterium]|nr:glycosyltransferase [Clostridia bacterium]